MPTKSAAFNGYPPSIDAIREAVKRLEQAAVQGYKITTFDLFPDDYSSVDDVADPSDVWQRVSLNVRDQEGSQDFSSLRAFFAHLDTKDYTEALGTANTSLPGASSGFTVRMGPGGELEVSAGTDEEVDYVLAPVRKEIRAARQAAEAEAAQVSTVRRRRWWNRVPAPLKWAGTIAGSLLVVYLAYLFGWN